MDLILFNGKIRTMDDNNPGAMAVAIKDGNICKVGTNEEILPLRQQRTKVIDLENRLVLPGFNDSHMHLLNYAVAKRMVNLVDASSLEDMVARTQYFIKENNVPQGDWILGRGWCQNNWEVKDMPGKADLDRISSVHPIMLVRVCGHVAVVNTKALELLGLLGDVPQIDGGLIEKDNQGRATGVFCEKALNVVYDSLPEPTIEKIKEMLVDASTDALSKGITSVQSDDFESIPGRNYKNIISAYEELVHEGGLPIRVYEQCLLPDPDRLSEFLASGYNTGYGNDFFRIGPLKLLADGSLGARTALLCEPYSDATDTCGISVFTQQQLDKLVDMAYQHDMQVAVHCIGDKAMYMVFESYGQHLGKTPKEDRRFSIIHCQITDPALLEAYKRLDVIAHIQPIFLQSDLHMVDSRVGGKRAKTSYCWRTMHETGVHVAHGSDCPVEKFDVLPGIYCAVTRMDMNGYPENGWYPEQCLSVHDAVRGFTLGAAYASFDENKKGSIAEGKFADLVVLSDDIFEIDKHRIKDVQVLMTIVNGQIKYENNSLK